MSATPSHSANRESHLSIGEVLNILREEFPDITISKIRFLESQGLIDPERTPSGYRKFYVSDVSRLRWILHQQKENFLPLKVIKERLDSMSADEQAAPVHSIVRPKSGAPRATPRATPRGAPPTRRRPRDRDLGPRLPLPLGDTEPAPDQDGHREDRTVRREQPERAEQPVRQERQEKQERQEQHEQQERQEQHEQQERRAHEGRREDEEVREPEVPAPARQAGLTRRELARAAGLEDWQVTELESFGLLSPVAFAGNDARFDEEGQAIAKAAAGFYAHGISARHLRMYKHFAEREAALFEQVLLPYLRQRNPASRGKAQEELADLAKLGRALRAALLVHAVRDSLTE